MSDEPIEWHDDGRITFHDFAGEDRTLNAPTLGDIWDLEDLVQDLLADYSRRLTEARELEDPTEEQQREASMLARRGQTTEVLAPWYQEVAKRLGATFPDDVRTWPSYMLTQHLPRQIQDHWKFNPKASGSDEAAR